MLLTNKTYDILRFFADVLLPALGALYFGLAQIWNLPLAEQIVGTISVIVAFLDALLAVSKAQYKKSNGNGG